MLARMKRASDNTMTVGEFASLGGKARAAKLSKARQSEIGRGAAAARWGDKHSLYPKFPKKKTT